MKMKTYCKKINGIQQNQYSEGNLELQKKEWSQVNTIILHLKNWRKKMK
jgi:hypothetical protein